MEASRNHVLKHTLWNNQKLNFLKVRLLKYFIHVNHSVHTKSLIEGKKIMKIWGREKAVFVKSFFFLLLLYYKTDCLCGLAEW